MVADPLAIDLYAGIGGWTEGLMASGWNVVGFDNERHVYDDHRYPAQLVIQDVRTLDGSQFKDAGLIVASPPCTEYSYMAMPWRRAKQIERALKGEDEFPEGYKGSRTVADLNELFDACFRIQREAEEAAGRRIPIIVENVCGAQKWVGPARWRHGSFYLWGDVPALMPITKRLIDGGVQRSGDAIKNTGGSWFYAHRNDPTALLAGEVKVPSKQGRRTDPGKGTRFTSMDCGDEAKKQGGDWWSKDSRDNGSLAKFGSKSSKRKAASAMIAKIPYELAYHIGRVYRD